jgi:hypothetical protein
LGGKVSGFSVTAKVYHEAPGRQGGYHLRGFGYTFTALGDERP